MKQKKQKILLVCLIVLAAVLLNVCVAFLPARASWFDVTEHRIYTLSDETEDYLSALDEPITVYLLNADGSDTSLEYYLARFCQYSRNLTFNKADAEDCGELLSRVGVSASDISSYTLVMEGEKRTTMLGYSDLFYYVTENQVLNEMGLTEMTTGEYYYYAQLFSQNEQYAEYLSYLLNDSHLYFEGESALLSMLEYVSAEIIPTHYVLTGHGEKDLSATLFEQIAVTFGGGYQVLNLSEVSLVPADVASLLLFAPTEDYSAQEIEVLRSYVDGGGLLTVVTNTEQLSFPNLTSLLSAYGLSAEPTVVCEEISVLDDAEQEEPRTEISEFVETFINFDHDAMASLDLEEAVPVIQGGNAIILDDTKDTKSLLTTSSNAIFGDDLSTKGQKILAASSENAEGAKLVWFTGAESFSASATEITEDPSTLYSAYSLYLVRNWTNLVYESQVTLPEAKLYDSSYLQMTNSGALFWMITTVVVLPLGAVSLGIVLHYKRKKT